MANNCNYRFIVQGPQNACYAFLATVTDLDGEVVEEGPINNEYFLSYAGVCAWYVDAHCKPYNGVMPVALPVDPQETYDYAAKAFPNIDTRSRSEMFQVDVYCIADPGDDKYRETFKVAEEIHFVAGRESPKDKERRDYLRNLLKIKATAVASVRPQGGNADMSRESPSKSRSDSKETVFLSSPYGPVKVERMIKDGDGKKNYEGTCAEYILVFSKATRIEASKEQLEYAFRSLDEGTKRLLAYRYLSGQVEIPGGKLNPIIKKHRQKLMSMLIADGNCEALQIIISISRNLKPVDLDELIAQAEKTGNAQIVACLKAEKNEKE